MVCNRQVDTSLGQGAGFETADFESESFCAILKTNIFSSEFTNILPFAPSDRLQHRSMKSIPDKVLGSFLVQHRRLEKFVDKFGATFSFYKKNVPLDRLLKPRQT